MDASEMQCGVLVRLLQRKSKAGGEPQCQ
jgi:hypothetical protein